MSGTIQKLNHYEILPPEDARRTSAAARVQDVTRAVFSAVHEALGERIQSGIADLDWNWQCRQQTERLKGVNAYHMDLILEFQGQLQRIDSLPAEQFTPELKDALKQQAFQVFTRQMNAIANP